MSEPTQACPICGTTVPLAPRYPTRLCSGCADRVSAPDGRRVVFFNEGLGGGFVGRYADSQAPYDSHVCFVDGVECRADEARFGGIVVQSRDRNRSGIPRPG